MILFIWIEKENRNGFRSQRPSERLRKKFGTLIFANRTLIFEESSTSVDPRTARFAAFDAPLRLQFAQSSSGDKSLRCISSPGGAWGTRTKTGASAQRLMG